MKIENEIEDIVKNLDENQKSAAVAPQGLSIISAGAGTGKTTTLATRISVLIARGIPASEIMAVTFTKKAAKELKERVEKYIGNKSEGLRIGTFHSLSSKILRKHALAAGFQNRNFFIIDPDDSRTLMIKAVETPGAFGPFVEPADISEAELMLLKKDYSENLRNFADRALIQVAKWKESGLLVEEASDTNRPTRSVEEERYAVAYSAYQYELESRGLVDFGDLILKVVSLLTSNSAILHEESSIIKHMLVDEAQDADQTQIEWVRLLTSYNGGLTVVGDEDQNIYGFRGGYPGAMKDMAGPTATSFSLVENRRCTQEILEPANIIVDYNRRSTPKILKSTRNGEKVFATGHATDVSEAAWIAGQVKELIDNGTEPHQIAVLFRSAFLIPPYEEAMLRKGIPGVVTSGVSLMDKDEIKDIMSMIKIAFNPYDELSFVRVVAKPTRGLGTVAIEAISNIVLSRGVPYYEALMIASNSDTGIGLRKDVRLAAIALSEVLSDLANKAEWCDHTHDIIQFALDKTGYVEWLKKQTDGEKRIKNVEAFHRLSESYNSGLDFLEDIGLLTDIDRSMINPLGKVRLSTIHSVKGLEFDHVFCPAFDFGVFPNPRAVEDGIKGKPGDKWNGPSGGGVQEERRLAHVAFTRAKIGLNVSFSWKRGSSYKKTKTGGPSCFVEECELKTKEIGAALTADVGRKKSKKRANVGFDR